MTYSFYLLTQIRIITVDHQHNQIGYKKYVFGQKKNRNKQFILFIKIKIGKIIDKKLKMKKVKFDLIGIEQDRKNEFRITKKHFFLK